MICCLSFRPVSCEERKARMRRVLTIALIVCPIIPAASHAQEESDGPDLDGKWALQFQITEDFTLSSFQGSIVSLKYHSSDQSAWRAGLSLDLSSTSEQLTNSDGGIPVSTLDVDSSTQSARLDLQYLRHARGKRPLRFVFGGGPFAGFANRTVERSRDGVAGPRQEYDEWSAGISALVGAEWFVGAGFSLHAEYGFEFSHERRDGSAESSELDLRQDIDFESTGFSSRGVLLGVSAYF
jgi:hypothetical protein